MVLNRYKIAKNKKVTLKLSKIHDKLYDILYYRLYDKIYDNIYDILQFRTLAPSLVSTSNVVDFIYQKSR